MVNLYSTLITINKTHVHTSIFGILESECKVLSAFANTSTINIMKKKVLNDLWIKISIKKVNWKDKFEFKRPFGD